MDRLECAEVGRFVRVHQGQLLHWRTLRSRLVQWYMAVKASCRDRVISDLNRLLAREKTARCRHVSVTYDCDSQRLCDSLYSTLFSPSPS
jgi:hypothetical protein